MHRQLFDKCMYGLKSCKPAKCGVSVWTQIDQWANNQFDLVAHDDLVVLRPGNDDVIPR